MAILDFSKALETPMKEFDFKFSFEPEFDEEVFAPHKVEGSAVVRMKYFMDFDGVLHLKGNLSVPSTFLCDRCASEIDRNLFFEFDEKIYPSANEGEDLVYNGAEIDVDSIFSNLIILSFPQKVLCREDCKGLCPDCGANLNDGQCLCSVNKIGKNNPFADLFRTKLGGKNNGSSKM